MTFIKRCHLNSLATNVKLMDLNDNMDLGRIKNPSKEDSNRNKTYLKAKKLLLKS